MTTKAERSAQRSTFAVQAKNEKKFSRSYWQLTRDLITPQIRKDLLAALKKPKATAASVLRAVPYFDPDNDATFDTWIKHAEQLERAYMDALDQTIRSQMRRYGWKFKTQKAEFPEPKRLPKNPTPEEWALTRSLERAVELSDTEKARVRALLTENISAGTRPEQIVAEIESTVGLTTKQWDMIENRLRIARDSGAGRQELLKLRQKFATDMRRQRANTIARTETIEAQAIGLKSSWNQARAEGLIEAGTKKKWVSFEDERTSLVCTGLNDQVQSMDDPFQSDIVGEVDHPPAHPNCRSTMVLEFP